MLCSHFKRKLSNEILGSLGYSYGYETESLICAISYRNPLTSVVFLSTKK